jgi:hypothetical protein
MAAVERNLRRVTLLEDIVLHLGASPVCCFDATGCRTDRREDDRLVTKRPANHTACKRLNFLQVVCQQVPRRSLTRDPIARMEKPHSNGFFHASGNAPGGRSALPRKLVSMAIVSIQTIAQSYAAS